MRNPITLGYKTICIWCYFQETAYSVIKHAGTAAVRLIAYLCDVELIWEFVDFKHFLRIYQQTIQFNKYGKKCFIKV